LRDQPSTPPPSLLRHVTQPSAATLNAWWSRARVGAIHPPLERKGFLAQPCKLPPGDLAPLAPPPSQRLSPHRASLKVAACSAAPRFGAWPRNCHVST